MPGGGFGIFDGCTAEWGTPSTGWGAQYGGISTRSQCKFSLKSPLFLPNLHKPPNFEKLILIGIRRRLPRQTSSRLLLALRLVRRREQPHRLIHPSRVSGSTYREIRLCPCQRCHQRSSHRSFSRPHRFCHGICDFISSNKQHD